VQLELTCRAKKVSLALSADVSVLVVIAVELCVAREDKVAEADRFVADNAVCAVRRALEDVPVPVAALTAAEKVGIETDGTDETDTPEVTPVPPVPPVPPVVPPSAKSAAVCSWIVPLAIPDSEPVPEPLPEVCSFAWTPVLLDELAEPLAVPATLVALAEALAALAAIVALALVTAVRLVDPALVITPVTTPVSAVAVVTTTPLFELPALVALPLE
jgi:hypothetical protein